MAKRQADIRNLAKRQRWLIWLVLIALVNQFLPWLVPRSIPMNWDVFFTLQVLVSIAILVCGLVLIILVLVAEGNHWLMITFCALFMFAPCVNILLLLLVNISATRTLRRAGIKVRFMGANMEEVERMLNAVLCKQCGYDLTGNVSGRCPECGMWIDQETA